MEENLGLLMSIGLSETKSKETLKNEKLSKNLITLIQITGPCSPEKGILLYHIASKMKPQSFGPYHTFIAPYVSSGKIDSEIKLNAAIEYLLKASATSEVDVAAFEEASGVGIVVQPEDIEKEVETVIRSIKDELISKRYRYNSGLIMSKVRSKLKWVDGKALKSEVDVQILDLLGPKTDADLAPISKKKEEKKKDPPTQKSATVVREEIQAFMSIKEMMKTKVKFHKPGDNHTTDGYIMTPQTKERLAAHLKRTGGTVRTRFPPEPNGILHIGHAKAININFGYAQAHDGVCFLRYDDTNPEKEEEKFFVAIKDIVEWLGYTPYKITHSSDYFDQLYEWAEKLIKDDLAYVCHQDVSDIRGFNPPPSPWRSRPIDESLRLFQDMKRGKFEEGEATLRLKLTLEEGKQDPVAYRIKYSPHHRTGSKWCIYPTYDYTHCLCDSLEDITHSLCTKEFQNRRSSYYWLCNAVEAYCPVQWEYGRLNVNYAVVSKRKIAKLIETGVCKDWDDPRLFTLTALRRRGFPSEAINNFVAQLGVTGALMTVDPAMLEASVRNYLNLNAPRAMAVLDPLKVTIRNWNDLNLPKVLQVSLFPDDPSKGFSEITLGQTIFIEQSDFKPVSEKGYRRLTPDQTVGLRYAGIVIQFIEFSGPNEIIVEAIPVDKATSKPKAFIHWVCGDKSAIEIEVRLYERLFRHPNPEDPEVVPGGFLSDVNPDSLSVKKGVLISSKSIKGAVSFTQFQFERIGFFSVDPESRPEAPVFNRTVSLKEDSGK